MIFNYFKFFIVYNINSCFIIFFLSRNIEALFWSLFIPFKIFMKKNCLFLSSSVCVFWGFCKCFIHQALLLAVRLSFQRSDGTFHEPLSIISYLLAHLWPHLQPRIRAMSSFTFWFFSLLLVCFRSAFFLMLLISLSLYFFCQNSHMLGGNFFLL